MFDGPWLAERLVLFIPLLLSLTVHEWAHAFAAWRLGDDTARLMGRLTLDPLAHIDPVGTLVLPLLGVPFGWAKPVPFNPVRFRQGIDMRVGMMIVAIAGPLSNLVLAVLCGAVLFVVTSAGVAPPAVVSALGTVVVMNVALACLNLLPIPPLDGSHVVNALLPSALRPAWSVVQAYGTWILAVVIVVPLLLGVDLLGVPLGLARALQGE